MDILKPIAKYFLDPLLAFYENSSHPTYLEEFEKTQYMTKEKIAERQFFLLKNLLSHAYRNCQFYTESFDKAGFHPNDFKTLEDIKKIPFLTKQDIQQHLKQLRAVNYKDNQLLLNQTGGSTGSPLKFYVDRERLHSRKASTFRHDRWAGWDIGVKIAVLWGHQKDFLPQQNWKNKIRDDYYERKLFLDTSHITAERMTSFVKQLQTFQPEIYLAYANSMYLYARYIKENCISDYNRPKAIITSAEVLTPEQRKIIEEVFDCKVFNRYGCRETSIIASECSAHNGMQISSETLYLEFQQKEKDVAADETGKIIITDLLNYGMPLIRYQIEDAGIPLKGDCPCGRTLPRMDISGGRVTDFLVTSERKVISGASMTIYFMAVIEGIAQAQIIQNLVDELTLRIVKSRLFSAATEKEIQQKVSEYFGTAMKYRIEYTDKIESTKSGKYRFSISYIDPMEFLS